MHHKSGVGASLWSVISANILASKFN